MCVSIYIYNLIHHIIEVKYVSLGCWKDQSQLGRAITTLEGTSPILNGDYRSRSDAIEKCYEVALSREYIVFALQNGGWCVGSADAESTYKKYGPSSDCVHRGKGGFGANEVYKIQRKY